MLNEELRKAINRYYNAPALYCNSLNSFSVVRVSLTFEVKLVMADLLKSLGLIDLLSKYKLKPWWETAHSAAILLMASVTVFLHVSSASGHLSCVPADKIFSKYYRVSEAKFVEFSCLSETQRALRWMYWLSLVGTTIIYVFSYAWTYIPACGKRIGSFVQLCDVYDSTAPFILEKLEVEKGPVDFNRKNALKYLRKLFWAVAEKPQLEDAKSPPNTRKVSKRNTHTQKKKNRGSGQREGQRRVSENRGDGGSSHQPQVRKFAPKGVDGAASCDAFNKKCAVELVPGTSRAFFWLYVARHFILAIISIVIMCLTSYQGDVLEKSSGKINCNIVHFAQNYSCVVLSLNAHKVVYHCLVTSSIAICFISYFSFVWMLTKTWYDVDLLISFAEHSSGMKIRNGLSQLVKKVNSPDKFKPFLQKCCVDAFDNGDLEFFEFSIQCRRMSAKEWYEEIKKQKSDENLKSSPFYKELLDKFVEWDPDSMRGFSGASGNSSG